MRKAGKLLILSRRAGSMTPAVEAHLREAFADHRVIYFSARRDFEPLITRTAQVVIAGGDGTVEHVVRKLADSQHPLGIIPMGSFNNFAQALGLPDDLDRAIRVIEQGHTRAITLGRVNKKVFLEACAVGLFGKAIVLGDAAKDLHFGDVVARLREVIQARPFEYELSGDFRERGTAMSLVFSNTLSIGIQLSIGVSNPTEPYLEFSAETGQSRTDIVERALESAFLDRHREASGRIVRFKRLRVRTWPRVRVYADNQAAGRTPATVSAEVSALRVLVPVRRHGRVK